MTRIYNVTHELPLGKTGQVSVDGDMIVNSETMFLWTLPDGTIKGFPIGRIYTVEVKEQ